MGSNAVAHSKNKYPTLTDEAVEEARSLIGVPLRRDQHHTLASRDLLLRFAKALGSRNPLYTDMSHGLLYTHWASLLGHPTSIFAFDTTVVAPKLAGIHSIPAGATIQWFKQIRAGDVLTSTARLTAVDELEGSFCGRMVLQTGEVEFQNQYGEVVALVESRVMRTPRDAARETGKYPDRKRHEYSEEEFSKIMEAYGAEQIRGSVVRYDEDVQIGDELGTVVKGPLTTEDMNFFVGQVSETLFYQAFLAHRRRHPQDVYWNPTHNMPDSWDASFLDDDPAREFGFPRAHDTGLQRICWLECLVTNWMGDLAVLQTLDVRLTAPFLHADTAWLSGRVTGRRVEGSSPIIELELLCDNQLGDNVARGTAEVLLPSRSFDVPQPGLVYPELWTAREPGV